MRKISICHWQNPFPHQEGAAVVFDIFRCSTTIHCLAQQNHGPLFVSASLQTAAENPGSADMRIFSELSQNIACKERYDNSPYSVLNTAWPADMPALVSTTTGTPAMFAARNFSKVFVGSLVNFSALIRSLHAYPGSITLIPAAFQESDHIEDEITAMAVAKCLEGFTDMQDFIKACAAEAKERITASHRPAHLAKKIPTGAADVEIALDVDRFSHYLELDFSSPKPFAQVLRHR